MLVKLSDFVFGALEVEADYVDPSTQRTLLGFVALEIPLQLSGYLIDLGRIAVLEYRGIVYAGNW